jgi:predicted PurR-regulated permease PerM
MDAPVVRTAEAGPSPREPDTTAAARAEVAQTRFSVRTAAVVTIAVLTVFYTLYFTAELVLPLAFAIVFDLLLQTPKRLLTRRLRFPSPLAAILLIVALLAVFAGIATALSVPASSWIAKVPQSLTTLEQRLSFLRGPLDFAQSGMQQLTQLTQASGGGHQQEIAVQQSSNLGGVGMTILRGTRFAFGQLLTFVVVLFFLLATGDSILRGIVEVLPTFGDKRRMVEIAEEIEQNVSSYLALITVMNLLVGTANGVQMWLLGMPDPLLWGTLAFLLNYIPILGPLTGVVIFFFVGLFSASSIWWALAPPAIYLVIHIIEGEAVTPMLLAQRMTLNPVFVIVSLFFWDFLWGVPGAFLAVPLLAITKVVCDRIAPLTPLGHVIGSSKSG